MSEVDGYVNSVIVHELITSSGVVSSDGRSRNDHPDRRRSSSHRPPTLPWLPRQSTSTAPRELQLAGDAAVLIFFYLGQTRRFPLNSQQVVPRFSQDVKASTGHQTRSRTLSHG